MAFTIIKYSIYLLACSPFVLWASDQICIFINKYKAFSKTTANTPESFQALKECTVYGCVTFSIVLFMMVLFYGVFQRFILCLILEALACFFYVFKRNIARSVVHLARTYGPMSNNIQTKEVS